MNSTTKKQILGTITGVAILVMSVLVSAEAKAQESNEYERIINKVVWVCDSSDLSGFKEDYKQCVRDGDWSVPGYNYRDGQSRYAKACEKFTLHLNCNTKK
jgi:hypothetical protein